MDASTNNIAQPDLARHDSRCLDLAFAMDTTGSMSSYITSARNNIRHIVEDIVAKESSDVRLALVEYRDHPPQDSSFVTRVQNFTPKVAVMKRALEASSAGGGGDAPEAVADALYDVLNLSWRPNATKICVLISDAPPHGLSQAGDGFPNGCPAGHDPMNIARQLAEKGVTLYVAGCEPALNMYKDFFAALAYVTGGQYVPLSAASALTAVIVGGAQEELSLEQWMEQVNQQVMAEVQAQGEQNINVEDLSRQVMGRLNQQGAQCKHLRVNQFAQAPASAHVKSMSNCADMASVRSHWQPSAPSPSHGALLVDDIAMSSPPPPDAVCALFGGPPSARGMRTRSGAPPMPPHAAPQAMAMAASSRSAVLNGRPMPQSAPSPFGGLQMQSAMPMAYGAPSPMGGAPMPAGPGPMMNAMSASSANCYDIGEGEIQMGQAERLVQKSLMRNNISLPKK